MSAKKHKIERQNDDLKTQKTTRMETLISWPLVTLCRNLISWPLVTLCHTLISWPLVTLCHTLISWPLVTLCHTLISWPLVTLCHTLISWPLVTLCLTLISWPLVIHFNPCKPARFLQTTAPSFLYRIFLFKYLVIYLVAFGDTTWKLSEHNFVISVAICTVAVWDHVSLICCLFVCLF